ncbi:MAG: winged helix-turn-helix domain-containing protein [Acidobacteria bacterium]|nr:winged helix-turn-helix domain-containing protein [Acidobacteriota bacterium]
MSNVSNNLYEFGDFTLNERERNLWRGDAVVQLPPKVFDTLLLLVKNAGSTVSKEEMLDQVWAGSFIEESNLSQNVYTLRQVLGRNEKFIETVPRRGYKFVKKVIVRELPDGSVTDRPEAQLHAPPTPAVAPREKSEVSHLRRFLAVAGIVSVWCIAAAFAFYRSDLAKSMPTETTVSLRSLTDTGEASSPTISPDGKLVAFLDRSGGRPSAKLMDVASGGIVEIKIDGNVVPSQLEFSADGSELFFRARGLWRSGRIVYRVPVFGGVPTEVVSDVWGAFGLSPDGQFLAFFREDTKANIDRLIIKNLKTGDERVIAELRSPEMFFILVPPAWSPDSKLLSVIKRPRSGERSEITTIDATTGESRAIRTELQKLFHMAWTPDGTSILALSKEPEKGRQLFRVAYPSGTVTRVTNDLNLYEGVSLSRDGRKVVTEVRNLTSNLWLMTANGREDERPLTTGKYGHYGLGDLKFATENRIIFDGRATVDRDLWSVAISDGSQVRLTENNGSRNSQVTATVNGEHLYVSSNRTGSESIWRIGQDGKKQTQITNAEGGESHWYPALSHDEKHLYFLARLSKGSEIRRISLTDMSVETIREIRDFSPQHFFQTSLDGKWLAFAYKTNEEETPDTDDFSNVPIRIGLIDLANPERMETFRIRSPRALIRFSATGESFDYIRDSSIVRQSIKQPDQEPEVIITVSGERIYNFDWSMAGTHAVVARGGYSSDLILIDLP